MGQTTRPSSLTLKSCFSPTPPSDLYPFDPSVWSAASSEVVFFLRPRPCWALLLSKNNKMYKVKNVVLEYISQLFGSFSGFLAHWILEQQGKKTVQYQYNIFYCCHVDPPLEVFCVTSEDAPPFAGTSTVELPLAAVTWGNMVKNIKF